MRQRRLIRLAAPALIGALVLAACSSEEDTGDTGGTGATKIAKIGFISPLSGDLSALGLGMKNAVDLAIKQANDAGTIKGWKLELAAEDDTAKADVGATVAAKLASDAAVVGVVATLNSSVAQSVIPVLDTAGIVQVSPANTNPSLTQGEKFATAKVRPNKNYFRVATTDAIQGPFAAQYVVDTLGLKRVAIIHDKKTYGQGLTGEFQKEFVKKGGTVTATETVNPGDKDFSAVISKVLPSKPDLIYYGGEYPECSLLSKQAHERGFKGSVFGGDGIQSGEYMKAGGASVKGDLATQVGAPTDTLASATKFVADYKAAAYPEPMEAYGAYAFDSAQSIILALAKVLPGKDAIDASVRQAIIDEVGKVSFEGVTGKVSFDEFGDNTTKVLTVYKVVDKAGKLEWAAEKTDSFK